LFFLNGCELGCQDLDLLSGIHMRDSDHCSTGARPNAGVPSNVTSESHVRPALICQDIPPVLAKLKIAQRAAAAHAWQKLRDVDGIAAVKLLLSTCSLVTWFWTAPDSVCSAAVAAETSTVSAFAPSDSQMSSESVLFGLSCGLA
jgi:hypothetical protein